LASLWQRRDDRIVLGRLILYQRLLCLHGQHFT
jgi:hypothetical protein